MRQEREKHNQCNFVSRQGNERNPAIRPATPFHGLLQTLWSPPPSNVNICIKDVVGGLVFFVSFA